MLNNLHECPSRFKPTCYRREDRIELSDVVQRQDADDDVGRCLGKREILDEGIHIADATVVRALSSQSQHAHRRIDADHSSSACIRRVATKPTVTAAKVKHSLSGQIGKQIR